jgi:hypothetical protein
MDLVEDKIVIYKFGFYKIRYCIINLDLIEDKISNYVLRLLENTGIEL